MPIYVGSFESPFEDELLSAIDSSATAGSGGSGPLPPGYGKNEAGETIRVETGVDKEEEGVSFEADELVLRVVQRSGCTDLFFVFTRPQEHHLQAVISASAAALLRSTRATGADLSVTKPAIAHIPTPDATGVVSNYSQFYKSNAYVDPHSYIRFGDTVEETMGIPYTMDEDDADWLEDYNASVSEKAAGEGLTATTSGPSSPTGNKAVNGAGNTPSGNGAPKSKPLSPMSNFLATTNGHYPPTTGIGAAKHARARKEKGKEVPHATSLLSEDDFELVMDLFERATDRKVPTLHLVSQPHLVCVSCRTGHGQSPWIPY